MRFVVCVFCWLLGGMSSRMCCVDVTGDVCGWDGLCIRGKFIVMAL